MEFEVYESAFNNEIEPNESPKPQPLKKYDETLFDPDLYGCWMVPKWTREAQAEAVASRRAKVEKAPKVKIQKPYVKDQEVKDRIRKMAATSGKARAAFLSFFLLTLSAFATW
jgi:hypothetical protein